MQKNNNGLRAQAKRRLAMLMATLGLSFAFVFAAAGAVSAQATEYDPVSAKVPVTVEVSGSGSAEAAKDQTFTFTIAGADGEKVLPEQTSLSVQGAGTAAFYLAFDEVGEHHYTVTQTAGSAERWGYDTQVYDVAVYCMWNEKEDSLYTAIFVRNVDGLKMGDEGCLFTNGYEAPAEPGAPSQSSQAGGQRASVMPQTGDTTVAVGAGVIAVAALCVAGGFYLRKRQGK